MKTPAVVLLLLLLLWETCQAQVDLESCCAGGEQLAQRSGACAAAAPASDRRCSAARRMCCVRALRTASCEQGKRAARQGRPCEGTLETFKDCCDACSMGLQSDSCSPPFSLGSPWDEAFRDCCPPPPRNQGRADRCQTENPCSHKCEDSGGVEVQCSCDPGYKLLALDRTTCIDVDECAEGGHTCSPLNETCVNTQGGFECQHKIGCPPGFSFNPQRSTCDDVDECRREVCPPNHQCVNSIGSFACVARNSSAPPCPRGFELQTETGRCIDVDECERGSHGCDTARHMCQNSHGAYQCVPRPARARACPAGFKWLDGACTDVDECAEGLTTCREPEERCRNTVGGYECDPACPLGLTLDPRKGACVQQQPQQQPLGGSECRADDECAPDEACSSSGQCKKRASAPGRCPPGFKPSPEDKSLCTDVDECVEFPEVCEAERGEVCRNEVGSYECAPCPPGHRSDGRQCSDINECAERADNCDRRSQQCINTEGGFQCAALRSPSCPPGYRARDGSCQDIDECLEGRHHCQPGREQCQNVAGAYRCQDVSPLPCPPGTRLQQQSDVCEDVDECVEGSATCEPNTQECVNTVGSFRCVPRIVCPHGYTWSEPKRKCEDVDECGEGRDDCDRRSQRCVNTPGSFQCQSAPATCGTGFAYDPNTDTCADINECELLRPCGAEQSCQNTEGSYRCVCHQGFTLDPVSKQCTDVNECQLRLHECSVSQRCDNTIGSYACVRIAGCGTGYTLNAHTSECEDDDECVLGSHNCGPGFACRNTAGSFRCARVSCPPGHRLLPDATCQQVRCPRGMQPDDAGNCADVNECAVQVDACRPSQRCVNTQGSFRCHNLIVCGAGFELDERGEQCVDVDECERQLAECHPDQTCKNRPGGYMCVCPKGYTIGPSRHCEDVDECSQFGSQVCASNSECINTQGSYTCNCKGGFRSSNNDKSCLDVDECSESPNICQQTCNNVWGSYQCSCKLGYTLAPDQRSCQDIDECAVYGGIGKLCIGFCVNEPGSFKCSCPQGYTLASDGRTCQDVDECAEEGVCGDPKAVCLNTRGGHKCNVIECPPNYVRDKDHRNRCKLSSRLSDCPPGAGADCLQEALSLSFNYITFVSRLQLPLSGQLDLFTMRGPRFKGTSVSFELELRHARPLRHGVPAAPRAAFRLRRTSYNEAMVSLAASLQGPQDIQLDLVMKIYHKGLFGGTAVAKIFIFVTEHEF